MSVVLRGLMPGRQAYMPLLRRTGRAILFVVCMISPQAMAAPVDPSGVWLMGTKVAIQAFDCGAMLCGRVI